MLWFLRQQNGGLNTWDFEEIRFIALGIYFYQKCKAAGPSEIPFHSHLLPGILGRLQSFSHMNDKVSVMNEII